MQHARQPDVTQNTATELHDRFMLRIVYCSCIMFTCSTSDLAARNTCFRGQTNQIWKTTGNGSKNELFVHLKMNVVFANAPAAIKHGTKNTIFFPFEHRHCFIDWCLIKALDAFSLKQ